MKTMPTPGARDRISWLLSAALIIGSAITLSVASSACRHAPGRIDVADLGHLGRVEADAGPGREFHRCNCDDRRRLALLLRASCESRGGFLVRIRGSKDLRIEQDLPNGDWATLYTATALELPRTSTVAEMTIFGKCGVSGEDIIGVHSCKVDVEGGCR
jgi:hypothetical protein